MIEFYKKMDAKLIKKYPKLWILGLHFYLPLLVVTYLILYGIGFAYSMDPLPSSGETTDFMSTISVFMIIPTILFTILFVIRQIKFNSLRIHHSLPYRNVILNFTAFVILSAGFFYLPFAIHLGTYHKAQLAIDEDAFLDDIVALQNGYDHFYNSDFEHQIRTQVNEGDAVYDEDALLDDFGEVYTSENVRTYRFDESGRNLILHRGNLIDYRLRNSIVNKNNPSLFKTYRANAWDTIPIGQAEEEINAFLAVCQKYEGVSTIHSPKELMKAHMEHADRELKRKEEYNQLSFIALKNDVRFNDVITFHENVIIRDRTFFSLSPDFMLVFIGFPLYFGLILLVLCSVRIVDFGWGMLTIALSITLYFTIIGFHQLMDGHNNFDAFAFGLLVLFVLLTAGLSFGKVGIKPGFRKALGIMFQLMLPIVVVSIFYFMDEFHECPLSYNECIGYEYFDRKIYYQMSYYTAIAFGLISVFVFNRFYEKRYVHPKD